MSTALLTDLYQLTMAQAYFRHGMRGTAVFELFVRRLPRHRRFLIAAGLAQIVEYLQELQFAPHELDFLAGTGLFARDFLDYLGSVRFSGAVHAMPEGTPFFPDEPIVRVTAPILEAQLVESRVLNLAHFQTLIASKAIRCVMAARGRKLVDFGMRRAHGAEAGLLAARAAYLAGFDATATVEAGRQFGIPLSGTMAHSFVEAHDREVDAFRNFLTAMGRDTTLLIDTYDTERAAHRVAAVSRELAALGERGTVSAVRIDSGDLAEQSRAVRRILDSEGRDNIQIFLSGNLDEYRIQSLLARATPVEGFGVGTSLDVSEDAPALDMAYKLVEYDGRPRRKRSVGKKTWPGVKQIFREHDAGGFIARDYIALADETLRGEPLLHEVMRNGAPVAPLPDLPASRENCRARVAELPSALRAIDGDDETLEATPSDNLRALARHLDSCGE